MGGVQGIPVSTIPTSYRRLPVQVEQMAMVARDKGTVTWSPTFQLCLRECQGHTLSR